MLPELFCHVGDHAGIGCRSCGQDRGVSRQLGQDVADASVVRTEVVPPVGDAVRFVDDDEAEEGQKLREDFVTELGVVQPLG